MEYICIQLELKVMGANLTNNVIEPLKDSIVKERKLKRSNKRKTRIEDYSPRVMTIEEIDKERIDRYQLIM